MLTGAGRKIQIDLIVQIKVLQKQPRPQDSSRHPVTQLIVETRITEDPVLSSLRTVQHSPDKPARSNTLSRDMYHLYRKPAASA